jgi:hypothetical protein
MGAGSPFSDKIFREELCLGVKNKLLTLINWFWSYITYDESLRLIIKPKIKYINIKTS